jgi:hypothetical protein
MVTAVNDTGRSGWEKMSHEGTGSRIPAFAEMTVYRNNDDIY